VPIAGEVPSGGGASAAATTDTILDVKYWLTYDDYYGGLFFDIYYLRAVSDYTEIWVQADRSWPAEDTRAYPEVTDEQVEYLLEEYDGNIYPIVSSYYGTPDFHDGSQSLLEAWGYVPPGYYASSAGKNVIMVSNVRDTSYYFSTYPSYIAGFYWSTYEAYFDRNIINIDSYDWVNRVGPDGSRPFMYEGTIAHEEQHLVHSDYLPDNEIFINEGFSDFAEMLCGYGIPWGHINAFLATPDNSLTEWGDHGGINILADYGAAALFAIYLNDQFGNDFISNFMRTGISGFNGLNYALFPMTFDDVYHNWHIANLIHSNNPGGGIYNYKSLNLADGNSPRVYELSPADTPWMGTDFGTTITGYGNDGNGFDTGVSMLGSYGSDFIKLTDFEDDDDVLFTFDGWPEEFKVSDDWLRVDEGYDGETDLEWYSTMPGNLADLSIISEPLVLPPGTVTLSFDTYIDIENDLDTGEGWDYGFVQISTDGGNTWTSLANEYTTIPPHQNAHPAIVSQLPGITGWYGYVWLSMDFDLTAYAGQTVLLRFRYMTDWSTLWEGWYVDNIAINGVVIDDADTTLAFAPFEIFADNDFLVTLIKVQMKKGMPKYRHLYTMNMDDSAETVAKIIDGFIDDSDYVLMIVSPTMGPADYVFTIS
jgi:hypothetical protein